MLFSRIRSLYMTSLQETIRRFEPDELRDVILERESDEEPRRLAEIQAALTGLFDKIWYDRHQLLRQRVESGDVEVVEKERFPIKDHASRPIQREIWEGALRSAKRVEEAYGAKNLGPWTEFEWGMLNGKLSALRWVLGDDWDMLDT
jgi:hypothetical protein